MERSRQLALERRAARLSMWWSLPFHWCLTLLRLVCTCYFVAFQHSPLQKKCTWHHIFQIPLQKNPWSRSSSEPPLAVLTTASLSTNFRPFMNSFSSGKKQKSLGPRSGKYGWHLVLVMVCDQVHCPGEQHTATQFSSSLLFQWRSTFTNQISVVGFCNCAAMFKTVNRYNSFRITEYSGHNFAGWRYHANETLEVEKWYVSKPYFALYF